VVGFIYGGSADVAPLTWAAFRKGLSETGPAWTRAPRSVRSFWVRSELLRPAPARRKDPQ